MANYLLVYHGGGNMPETQEEQQQIMQAWGKWFEDLGQSVVDSGNPIAGWKTVASDGAIADGGGNDPVTGYSIIDAESLDDASKKTQGCPHLQAGGRIEVCETVRVM